MNDNRNCNKQPLCTRLGQKCQLEANYFGRIWLVLFPSHVLIILVCLHVAFVMFWYLTFFSAFRNFGSLQSLVALVFIFVSFFGCVFLLSSFLPLKYLSLRLMGVGLVAWLCEGGGWFVLPLNLGLGW